MIKTDTLDDYIVKAIYFVISFAICVGAYFIGEIDTVAWLCFGETVFSLCLLWRLNYKLSSFPFLFVLFTFLFHASQFWVNTFVDDYDKPADVFLRVGEITSIFTIRFTMLSIVMLTIGIIFSGFFNLNQRNLKTLIFSNDLSVVGRRIIAICLIPRVFVDVLSIVARVEGGYLNTYEQDISGILNVFGFGFYVGVIWYIVGNRENVFKSQRMLFFVITYILFTMLSGRREYQIGYLITMLVIYHRYVRNIRINMGKILIMTFVGHLAIAFVMTMGDLRMEDNLNSETIISTLQENLSGKVYADIVGEFGGTGISLAQSFNFFPSYRPYNYGKTYVYSFLQVLPNVGGYLRNFDTDNMFVLNLPRSVRRAIGGSFLGELYFNFGWFGAIICLLIGAWLGMFQKRLDNSFIGKNIFPMKDVALLLLAPFLLVWIRGYFYEFIRIYFWYYAILLIMTHKERSK